MTAGVRLLGAPQASAGGAWLPLEPNRPHAVLAYVAVRGGFVRRAELAALLWPEADAAHAHTGLRQVLRRLDKGPFGALVGRDRAGLWLACGGDVPVFREAIDERRWRDALAAHGGPLLDGFALDEADEFAAWLEGERAAVAQDWRHACLAALTDDLDAGRYETALRLGDHLIAADAFDEQATRLAMRAAAAAGDLLGVARRYEALAALLARETGLEPEAETQALWARLAASRTTGVNLDPLSPPQAAAGLVTAGERRGLIGREEALAELVERLRQREFRLITLLGPGGIGKTRLAAALVAEMRTAFGGGVHMVPLEDARGPDAVALAVAQVVGVPLLRGAPVVTQLTRTLAGRRALLVLDGFELHLDQVRTIDELLQGAPDLRVVVTSRVRLRHSHEVVFDVDPLETRGEPIGPEQRTTTPRVSPAAQLFLRAAATRLPLSVVRRFDLEVVERIAESLGGHPLAIELAASWVDVLGLANLEAQVQTSWAPLQSEDVDRSERRRDVRAVVEEAWEQLAPEDRAAWARLAVMPSSLDRAVAAEVGGSGWLGLRRLLDRAVLRHDGERLALHPLLARFGREQAVASGISDATWQAAVRVWRERIAQQVDARTGRRVVLHRDDLEQALGAWRWAQATRDWAALADMAVGLQRALDLRMRWPEAAAVRREAVGHLLPARGRDRDVALARLWPKLGDTPFEEKANAARALELAEARSDDLAAALAHARLARGNFTAERAAHIEEARACFERAGDEVGLAELCLMQGDLSVLAGHRAHAAGLLDEARSRYERLADADGLMHVHVGRCQLALQRGDLATADAELQAARDLATYAVGGRRLPVLASSEVELARAAGDREQAAAAIESFVREVGAMRDTSYAEIMMRTGLHLWFGPPDRLLAYAGRWAAHPETHGGRTIHRMLANLCVAMAHAQLGSPERAGAPIALAVRLARPWEVPRVVAVLALTAAHVAAARGERDWACRMVRWALQHPSLEYEARRDANALSASLSEGSVAAAAGEGAGVGAEGGGAAVEAAGVGGVPPPDGAAPLDDAAILDEVERWLACWAGAVDGGSEEADVLGP